MEGEVGEVGVGVVEGVLCLVADGGDGGREGWRDGEMERATDV